MNEPDRNSRSNNRKGGNRNPSEFIIALTELVRSYAAYNREKAERIKNPKPQPEGWAAILTAFGTVIAAILAFVAAVIFWCQLATMQQANLDNRDALIQSQRAWVFPTTQAIKTNIDKISHIPVESIVSPFFENTGNTPAFHATCWDAQSEKLAGIGNSPDSKEVFGDIGPHQKMYCQPIQINAAQLQNMWTQHTQIFIWARIEYTDAFPKTPLRHTEFCGEIELRRNPFLPVDLNEPGFEMLAIKIASSTECNSAN
jgi:hypothetical protein